MEKQELVISLEEDLNEISKLIWRYLDQKYIGAMKNKVDGYRSECSANLCKEAQLIQAVMPFMPEERKILQLIVDAMMYNDIIEKAMAEHKELGALYRDENKEREQLKKLVYKLVFLKVLMTIDQMSADK